MEASGWPKDVETCADPAQKTLLKKSFIEKCKKEDGIELREDRVCVNSGLRFMSKLALNSLWAS